MMLQGGIDPNEFVDPTGIGWEELGAAALSLVVAVVLGILARRYVGALGDEGPKR